MGKLIDIVGQVFGKLTVVERAGSDKKKQALYRCVCECGNEIITAGVYLRRGDTKSCGCLQKEKASQLNSKDYTGQKIGHLTVLGLAWYREYNAGRDKLYEVQCDCGCKKVVIGSLLGRKNPIQSCGCMTSSIITQKNSTNIIGQVFGRLTAINPERTPSGYYGWRCRCSCGNEIVTTLTALRSGHTTSCGCYHDELCRKDIAGQKFGLLTAIDIAYTNKNNVFWNCQCDCGDKCIVNGSSLRCLSTISCGCLRSSGENIIKDFLDRKCINYYREKRFNGCKDVGSLKFDFWLPDLGMCIEFDGVQHYEDVPQWDKSSTFEDRQRRDAIKTKYCEENDIILLRIPYWEKDNIESILTDWLFLNGDEEANSSDAGLSA